MFACGPPHGRRTRRIRILNLRDRNGGDWLYSAQKCFPELQDLVFECKEEDARGRLNGWWERVVDAVREGHAAGERKRGELRVSVEGRDGLSYLSEVF